MRSLLGPGVMVLVACTPSGTPDDHSSPSAPPIPSAGPVLEDPNQPGSPTVNPQPGPRGGVVAGLSFTCAWREDGEAYCWGSNESGQLGAAPDDEPNPQAGQVPGLGPVTQLAAGDSHACALRADGRVVCWGSNEYGELGFPSSLTELPRPVPGITEATRIAAGITYTCAIRTDDALWCWGGGEPEPKRIEGLGRVVDVALGLQVGCALDTNGTVSCWLTRDRMAKPVVGVPASQRITTRLHRTCALGIDGASYCWEPGQPVTQLDAGPLLDIAAGYDFVCSLEEPRRVRCTAGGPDLGTFGPVQSLGAGGRHACALHDDGVTVRCDGANGHGQTDSQSLP